MNEIIQTEVDEEKVCIIDIRSEVLNVALDDKQQTLDW